MIKQVDRFSPKLVVMTALAFAAGEDDAVAAVGTAATRAGETPRPRSHGVEPVLQRELPRRLIRGRHRFHERLARAAVAPLTVLIAARFGVKL